MIAVIDVGLCNAGSILNMLRFLGIEATRTASPAILRTASKLILPGVGSFDGGRERLEASGLVPLLSHRVLEERVPVLGICLGMQLMTLGSDEGRLSGFGWVKAHTRRFTFPPGVSLLRVPHIGWNTVEFAPECPLGSHLSVAARFYFVHSYHAVFVRPDPAVLHYTSYGYRFVSGFSLGNIHGVQFHPEKSHSFGLQLFRNFAALPVVTNALA